MIQGEETPEDIIARLENEIEHWKKRHMELEAELREKQTAVCEACLKLQELYGYCKLGEAKCPVETKLWPQCLIVGPGYRKRLAATKCNCMARPGDTGTCPIHNPPTAEVTK
jgi:hypothetical protein